MHSEYVEFYNSIRYFLPLKITVKEMIENLVMDSYKLKFVSRSTVYEDNTDVIAVENSSRMAPTSNHISVKYYWWNMPHRFYILTR